MPKPWNGLKTLAVATLKGGVGKSTTTMMLADTLATHHGLQVLIVDLDAQANASQMILGFAGLKRAKSANKTLTSWVQALARQEREDFFESITPDVCGIEEVRARRSFGWNSNKERGDTAIVAATPELRFAEMDYDQRRFESTRPNASRISMTASLRKGIASLGRAYDLVIFDCPPGFTTLAQSAIGMADAIISPMFEDPVTLWSLISFRDFGLKQTLDVWDRERHRVLFTRVSSSGARDQRAKVRDDTRAEFLVLPVHIRNLSQAVSWSERPDPTSHDRFSSKYGSGRQEVIELGNHVVSFIAALPTKTPGGSDV